MSLPSQSDDHMAQLTDWANERGLEVVTSEATQREPEYVVSIKSPGAAWQGVLIQRKSQDSDDTAAFYLINTLRRLRAWGD